MADRSVIQFVLQGIDQTAKATQSSAANLNNIAKAANTLQSIALVALIKRSARATAELTKMGADSLKTRDRLVAFAGGAKQADTMLAALNKASDNTIDRLTGMAMATSLIEQGLVTSTSEMEMAAAMVAKLGRSTLSTEGRMNSLTLMLANESRRRLDDFGLSVDAVTTRQKELMEAGMSSQAAFKTAVFEQAGEKLGVLGDQSDTAATKIGQVTANWQTMTQVMGESLATIAASNRVMGGLSDTLATVAQRTMDVNEGLARARELGVAPRVYAEAYADAAAAARTFQGDEENLRAAIEEKNAAMMAAAATTENTTAAEWAAVQQTRAIYNTYAGFVAQRQQNKLTEAAAVEAANLRMASSTLSYQQTAAGIYASLAALELGHARRMEAIASGGVGGGRKSLMGAIAKAQSKELAGLQAKFEERDWQKSLEKMATDHEDKMLDIRKDGDYVGRQQDEKDEIERYTTERDSAIARREQQKADEAERVAIIKKFDKRRRKEQAAMEGAAAGQAAAAREAQLVAEQASYEKQKEALNTRLVEAAVQYDLVLEKHKELLDTILGYAQKAKERMDRILARNAQVTGGPRPKLHAGTDNWRGGPAWVGEREPELLNIPRGSSVTPLSKMGGVTVNNYFSAGAVRSDRDITRLADQQRRSLRLHGRAN